jgi:solute carrier family 25 protein 34/35
MGERNAALMGLQFTSGSLAACGAVTVTNPFDMLKTRRQLNNELGLAGSRGKINLSLVFQKEGLAGLQRGLVPAYIYQILMNGTRFMVYEPTRLFLKSTSLTSSTLLCNASAGAIAGGIAALIGTPFNLIKTRLQSYSPHFSTGYQHGYTGVLPAIKSIYASEGLRGFYRGVSASMLRTTAGSAAQLSSYDWCKAHLVSAGYDDGMGVYLTSAMTSGVIACLVMNPFDVVMTRLYNQKAGTLYSGVINCATKTIQMEGLGALWRGLVPHFIRIGPHTVLTLVLLEQVRNVLRPAFFSN